MLYPRTGRDYTEEEAAQLKAFFIERVEFAQDKAEVLAEDAFAVIVPFARLIARFREQRN